MKWLINLHCKPIHDGKRSPNMTMRHPVDSQVQGTHGDSLCANRRTAPRLETQGFVCLDDVAGHRLDLFAFEHGL
jgi:hypothetical protein